LAKKLASLGSEETGNLKNSSIVTPSHTNSDSKKKSSLGSEEVSKVESDSNNETKASKTSTSLTNSNSNEKNVPSDVEADENDNDLGDISDDPNVFQPPEDWAPPPTRLTTSGRIVAIGDVHGDLVQTMRVLQVAGLMAPPSVGQPVKWIGGDSVLIQMGDVLDRGDDEIGIFRVLWQLAAGAREVGGAVYILNGNHETLNVAGDFRYVTPGAFRESAIVALGHADFGSSQMSFTMQARARLALFSPGAPMARKLAVNPTVLIVNDTLFVHGGLLPEHVMYGLERINEEVSLWMMGGPEPPEKMLYTGDSIVWNRLYSIKHRNAEDYNKIAALLQHTLSMVGCKRMVVGHTPQDDGCNASFNNTVWRVDVGMSVGVLGAEVEALEIVPRDPEAAKSQVKPKGSAFADEDVEINILKYPRTGNLNQIRSLFD